MTRLTYEGLRSDAIKHDGTWLFPFGGSNDDEKTVESATTELEAINEELQGGNIGDGRKLTEEEQEALTYAGERYEYYPSVRLTPGFSTDAQRSVMAANLQGYELAAQFMEESNFATFTAWKKLLRDQMRVVNSRGGDFTGTVRDESEEDSPLGHIDVISPFYEAVHGPPQTFYFNEEEQLDGLEHYSFLLGFQTYFEGLKDRVYIPLNNAYTRALAQRLEERVSPPDNTPRMEHMLFDVKFVDAIRKYHWLYTLVEAAHRQQDVDPSNFVSSMVHMSTRLRNNDEIGVGSVLRDVDMNYLISDLSLKYPDVDRLIERGSLEINIFDIYEIARDFTLCYDSEEELLQSWGVDSIEDLEVEDSVRLNIPRLARIEKQRRVKEFLEERELTEMFLKDGIIDLEKFRSEKPFWKFREDWKPTARRRVIDQLVIALGVESGLIKPEEIPHIDMGKELSSRTGI